MEYTLVSLLGYEEFNKAMKSYFKAGWNIYYNVVVTNTHKVQQGEEGVVYTQWLSREDQS